MSVQVHGEERVSEYVGALLLRESVGCLERVWWPSLEAESSSAYTLRWTCSPQVEATWSELAAMELDPSVYTALRPSLEGDGASFGLLTDLRGDVVGLVDEAGRKRAELYAND
ncbi:MAG: hypothetical protein RBU37_26580 [Myxococcota bacterium]|nr:hypothetical protein [Myxococcota bacterium]